MKCYSVIFHKVVPTAGELKKALESVPDDCPVYGDFPGDEVCLKHFKEDDTGEEFCALEDANLDDWED